MENIQIAAFFVMTIIVYNRSEKIRKMLAEHRVISRVIMVGLTLSIAGLFAFELELCPFAAEDKKAIDTYAYLYIGRGIYHGLIPYRDLFDHKGIILYLIEAVGWFLRGVSGVWLLEFANAVFTIHVYRKLAGEFCHERMVGFLVSMIVVMISLKFTGGNSVEGYSIPWIALALYYSALFWENDRYELSHVFIMGVSFSILFFLRPNIAGAVFAILIADIIVFIKDRKTSELPRCAAFFMGGCLVIGIPLLTYFICTGSLTDMLRYYIVFNIAYSSEESFVGGMIPLGLLFLQYSGVMVYAYVYAFVKKTRNPVIILNTVSLMIAFLFAAVGGRGFVKYAAILLPFFTIPVAVSLKYLFDDIKERGIIIKNTMFAVGTVAILFWCLCIRPVSLVLTSVGNQASESEINVFLSESTDSSDNVFILGNYCRPYIETDRYTSNRFFYQTTPYHISNQISDELMNELSSKPSDYVIVPYLDDWRLDGPNEQKVLEYYEKLCVDGRYKKEKYDTFYVYIRM